MKKEPKIVMIYLNNAATTLFKPPEVIKAATISALSVGRSAGFDATAEKLSALREKLLKLTNARDHFVVLTPGCTFALNQAILGLAARLPPCRILVTQAAHNAVLRPVYALAKKRFPCAINAADEFGRVTPTARSTARTSNQKTGNNPTPKPPYEAAGNGFSYGVVPTDEFGRVTPTARSTARTSNQKTGNNAAPKSLYEAADNGFSYGVVPTDEFGRVTPTARSATKTSNQKTGNNAAPKPLYEAADNGFSYGVVPTDEFGRVTPETLAPYLTPDVKIVVISHMSNVTGGIDDIAAITKLLRSRGIYSIVDCAQSVGIMNVDLSNIDIAAFPFHKSLHALSGIGAMIVREGIEMEPLVYGGTGTLSADKDMPDFPPERYEAGTHNLPAINAALAALDWLEKYEEEIRGNLDYIGKRLYNGLYDLYPKVKILSCDNPGAIVTFVTTDADFDSAVFAQSLYDHGFVVRGGLHCAPLMHERLGTSLSGAVRVSPGIDTTETQIDSFLLTVKRLISP